MMAKESINTQVTSEIMEFEDGEEKANPNGRLITKKGEHKILSRYLSGPTGSCHDLCKYGIKHAVESKPWSAARKRATTREWKYGVSEKTVTSFGCMKKSANISETSRTSKIGESSCPVVIKEVVLSLTNEKTVSSGKDLPPSGEINLPVEHTTPNVKSVQSEPSSLLVQERSNSQTNRKIVKYENPFGSSSGKKSESSNKQRTSLIGVKKISVPPNIPHSQTNREVKSDRISFVPSSSKQSKTSLIGDKIISVPPNIPLSSKHYVKNSSSISAKTVKKQKGLSHLRNQKNVEEIKSEIPSIDKLPEKILHVIEPTSEIKPGEPMACDATNLSLALPSSPEDKSLMQSGEQIGMSGLPASLRKNLKHSKHGIRPIKLAPSPLSSGNKGKRHMQKRMHSTSSSLASLPPSASTKSPSNSSLGKQNGATSKYNKTGPGCQRENLKIGYKIRPKRSTIVVAGNNVIPSRKLTFKRGKVVELQQPQSNILRRLRFRPIRLLTDPPRDENDSKRGIFRRKEVIDGETNYVKIKSEQVASTLQNMEGSKRRSLRRRAVDGRKIDGSTSRSEEVVLRHQNVEGKKVSRRLYNNVIEETASKLAELRQSKVKALVGAFETVISLDSHQGAKPMEISSAC